MSGFCYERLPFSPGAITRRPPMAMDAALPPSADRPLIGDDAFKQVLEVLKDQLDEQTFGKVRDALAGLTKMSMDQPAAGRVTFKPENVERALDFLRKKGLDEETIAKVRELGGLPPKPSQAQDAARRERNRERDQAEYYRRFPEVRRLSSDGGLAFDRATDAAQRRREADNNVRNGKSYAERWPEAERIKIHAY
jgi:hypothetical protein